MSLNNVNNQQGFSVVEAIVVLTVVGLLITLGYSRYNYHVAKSRQGEAKNNLKHLVTLQETYLVEHKNYSNMPSVGLKSGGHHCEKTTPGIGLLNELGFRPKDCEKLRYRYWTARVKNNLPVGLRYTMRADSNPAVTGVYIWPDCNSRDMWRVHNRASRDGGGGGHVHQPGDHEFSNTGKQRRALDNCK